MPTPEYDELKAEIEGLRRGGAAAIIDLDTRVKENTFNLSHLYQALTWIWGMPERVSLNEIFHRGFYSYGVKKGIALADAVRLLVGAFKTHLGVHNTTGGAADTLTDPQLDIIDNVLDKTREEGETA